MKSQSTRSFIIDVVLSIRQWLICVVVCRRDFGYPRRIGSIVRRETDAIGVNDFLIRNKKDGSKAVF